MSSYLSLTVIYSWLLVLTDGDKPVQKNTSTLELCEKPGVCVKSRSAFYIKETSLGGWFLCIFADIAIFAKVGDSSAITAKEQAIVGRTNHYNNKKAPNCVGAHLRFALEIWLRQTPRSPLVAHENSPV